MDAGVDIRPPRNLFRTQRPWEFSAQRWQVAGINRGNQPIHHLTRLVVGSIVQVQPQRAEAVARPALQCAHQLHCRRMAVASGYAQPQHLQLHCLRLAKAGCQLPRARLAEAEVEQVQLP